MHSSRTFAVAKDSAFFSNTDSSFRLTRPTQSELASHRSHSTTCDTRLLDSIDHWIAACLLGRLLALATKIPRRGRRRAPARPPANGPWLLRACRHRIAVPHRTLVRILVRT